MTRRRGDAAIFVDDLSLTSEALAAGLRVRYVVLHHTGIAAPHYDFMVQVPGRVKLLTWRVAVPPEQWPPAFDAVERVADHRAAYMTFEGEIFGDRGSVERVAEGEAEVLRAGMTSLLLRLTGIPPCDLEVPITN